MNLNLPNRQSVIRFSQDSEYKCVRFRTSGRHADLFADHQLAQQRRHGEAPCQLIHVVHADRVIVTHQPGDHETEGAFA